MIEQHIENLKKYIEKDPCYSGKSAIASDFDKFCYNHCKDIDKVLKKLRELDKDNNDLRLLYRKTAKKLMENGKEELADYFLAQINEVPTFVVDDDIDYYDEYHKLLRVTDKMAEQLAGLAIWDKNKEEPLILTNVAEVKEYFMKESEQHGRKENQNK